MSSATLTLGPDKTVSFASSMICDRGTPIVFAAQSTTNDRARPIRFQVSSTRPAPSSGDESSATFSFCQPKSPVRLASSTVRSKSFRSRSAAIIRSRKRTSTPCENGASSAPKHPSTSCHRLSISAVTTASASPT
jgi:hypothetical protein